MSTLLWLSPATHSADLQCERLGGFACNPQLDLQSAPLQAASTSIVITIKMIRQVPVGTRVLKAAI
jgi:hypothetical protein